MHKGEEGTCGKWSEWGRISVCGVVQAYRKLLGFDSTRKQRRDPFVNPGSPAVAFTPGALRPVGNAQALLKVSFHQFLSSVDKEKMLNRA